MIAIGIGTTIALAPQAFYGSSGISLPDDPDLLSELRAPGTNLAVLGALIFTGALRPSMTWISALIGTVVFVAYAAGRLLGIAFDGLPSDPLLLALVIELAIGILCATALRRPVVESDAPRPPQFRPEASG
jgi:hypothetical protein